MKKQRQQSKQNFAKGIQKPINRNSFSPNKAASSAFTKAEKDQFMHHLKNLLKPKEKSLIDRQSAAYLSQSNYDLHDIRSSFMKSRMCTETLPINGFKGLDKKQKQKDGLCKGNKKHKSVQQLNKQRISMSTANQTQKPFRSVYKLSHKEEMGVDWQDIAQARKQIQSQVKKSSSKALIQKKQLLKITNKYQKLLTKVINCSQASRFNPNIHHRQSQQPQHDSVTTVRRAQEIEQARNLPVQKKKLLLKLQDVKGRGIMDYNDEFMSHYEELSQSWKRDIEEQKRF